MPFSLAVKIVERVPSTATATGAAATSAAASLATIVAHTMPATAVIAISAALATATSDSLTATAVEIATTAAPRLDRAMPRSHHFRQQLLTPLAPPIASRASPSLKPALTPPPPKSRHD